MKKSIVWAAGTLTVIALAVFIAPMRAVDGKDAPAAEKPRDFSGKYIAEGVGNGDKSYKAMVEITREGETYEVVWVLGPREAYRGVGLVENGSLCIGWATGSVPGLVIFKPDKDKLIGRWVAPGGGGKVFKETLTPLK